jgi:tRNA(Ile)-lysidine synthase
MPYAREDGIIRPLLAASRQQVLAYLNHERLTYRRDSSNEQTFYHRNRIRKELFPVLAQVAPAAVRVLGRQADLLREDEHFLEGVTDTLMSALVNRESHGEQRVDHQAFTELPVALQRRLTRAILRTYDEEGRASSLAVVESVRRIFLKEENGTRLVLKQVVVTLDHGVVRFSPAGRDRGNLIDGDQNKREGCTVPVPSTVSWAGTNQEIHVQRMTRCAADELGRLPTQAVALFDADRFSEPLVVRSWQAGDRFFPHGMNGKSKKLQDFFTDKKVARHGRRKVPLLVAPEGILWVVGMRQDERFVVRSETTQCVVVSVHHRMRERE